MKLLKRMGIAKYLGKRSKPLQQSPVVLVTE